MKDLPGTDASPPHPRRVVVEAPAKVNLGLKILRRRPDGYHDLDTVFQAVSLADTLTLAVGEASARPFEATARYCSPDGVCLEISGPDDVPCNEENLALKAARLIADETGHSLAGLHIHILKRIPPGGGLAGGSTDAAGILYGLKSLWALDLSGRRLRELGLRLGSDVPFCLLGGTARGHGRGERLIPIHRTLEFWMTMVNAGIRVNTSKAFSAFDPARHGKPGTLDPLVEALEYGRPTAFLASLENTFEDCVGDLYPGMADLKKELISAGASAALLSGSGATVWGLFWDETEARRAAQTLRTRFPFVEAVKPLPFGPWMRKQDR